MVDQAEPTPTQEVFDGQRVKALLEDPAVQRVFDTLDQECWKVAKTSLHAEARQKACDLANAIDCLKQGLRKVVDAGTIQQAREKVAEVVAPSAN